ncbi:P-type conjugative transfer protein TrbJ [Hyphomonas oceanitis]|uniref:P-type conjugative transfer protein TrbJ n=1 Tax=Hyphomonas oceanitis TaxID=81033 RepID=UPI0030027550
MSLTVPRADALLGVGDVVIDPTNLVQNIVTATNTLEQINNQITQLQHEAQMLVNQAEDLKRLDYASIEDLKRLLERINTLMREADEITYDVGESERRYEEAFPESYKEISNEKITILAKDQWRLSRSGFAGAVQVQSGIVSAIADSKGMLSELVSESQSASGNLSVAQAGNQLIALVVEQQMQMQQLMAAHYRMEAVEASRRAALEEQARVRHERFRGDGAAYTRN